MATKTGGDGRSAFGGRLLQLGVLRLLLLGLAFLFICLLPFSFAGTAPRGLDLILGGFIPAAAPLLVFVILFDALMCQVLKGDGGEAERRRFSFILRVDLAVAALLAAVWLGRFLPILLP